MIPLYKPHMPEQLPELNSILYSGALSYGYWGKCFEQKLSNYLGGLNIGVVNSFNSAILVLIATLDLKPGDEIVASPMSCLASNQPFITSRIKIVWADIDPHTGTLCPDDVKKKITKKTKVIFHNHHCGYLGYIDELRMIANENGIFLVDDAIEAFGSVYKGNKVGNLSSDATVYSFQTVRLPNVIDGGAFSFKNDLLFEKAKRIRDYGIDRKNFRTTLGEISKDCDINEPGFGATLNEINSYIGTVQMDSIEEKLNLHRENALSWKTFFDGQLDNYKLIQKDTDLPNYWIFGVLAKNKFETIEYFRAAGYYASGVHLPNNYYSVFGNKVYLKGVEDFYSRFVALPCGWWFKR